MKQGKEITMHNPNEINVDQIDWNLSKPHIGKLVNFLHQCNVHTINDLKTFCLNKNIFKSHKYTTSYYNAIEDKEMDRYRYFKFGKRYRFEIEKCLKFFYPNEHFDLSMEFPKKNLISYSDQKNNIEYLQRKG